MTTLAQALWSSSSPGCCFNIFLGAQPAYKTVEVRLEEPGVWAPEPDTHFCLRFRGDGGYHCPSAPGPLELTVSWPKPVCCCILPSLFCPSQAKENAPTCNHS